MSRNAPFRLNFAVWLRLTVSLLLAQGMNSGWAAEVFAPNGTRLARVISVQDPKATEAFRTDLDRIETMLNRGITNLTRRAEVRDAWLSLVNTQDVIGIKVYSLPGPLSGTRPAVVEAVLKGLLASGISSSNIIIWDRQAVDLRLAGFFELGQRYGVRVQGSVQAGWDESVFYDDPLMGNLVWGDLEFGKKGDNTGRKSFVSKLLTREITKIINISPLLNHISAGVSGNLFSLASGSVDNFGRFEARPERLPLALPDIYGLPGVGDRVVLNITDALICQYEGGERGLLHYSATLNELRFSTDPVALDVLSLKELRQLRSKMDEPHAKANDQIFKNAALEGVDLGVADLKNIRVETVR